MLCAPALRRCSSSPKAKQRRSRGGELVPAARRCPRRNAALRARTARSAAQRPLAQHRLGQPEAGGPFGERVITGLPEGVSLRLEESVEGESFTRVLALGAAVERDYSRRQRSAPPSRTRARAGWAQTGLPVHLTPEPAPSRLKPWPVAVPPRAAGVAPQPGCRSARSRAKRSPSATRARSRASSPARAGCRKACSGRASGWKRPGCARSRGPRPTAPTRSATKGQMWLWRGETGLWEQDPATPMNFRGNLLGIAFDPEPERCGYAVGSLGTRREAPACCSATARPGRRKRHPNRCQPARASPRSRSPARRRSSPTAVLPNPAGQPVQRRPARQRRLGLAGRPGSSRANRGERAGGGRRPARRRRGV